MFSVTIEDTISCSHQLVLPYESPCNRLHGHNYKIQVRISSPTLNGCGMVVDFSLVKEVIRGYDHRNLNEFFQPTTAEFFAFRLREELMRVIRSDDPRANKNAVLCVVRVSETPNTWAANFEVSESV